MKSLSERITAALSDWQKITRLQVKSAEELTSEGENTLGTSRRLLGLLKPSEQWQVPEIVKIANAHGISLYTVSTGLNWGYGSALPAVDDCVILNLGNLNKILSFDADLGCVTVEPGVTQGQLHEYLKVQRLPFMVPTTGAGPSCSLIGNALEKGYGITPYEDHFGALLNLKAVLPNGSLYQSTLSEIGGHRVDRLFKWKLGPFLEGLFAQGNFGIVTQATISLARKPENIVQFIIFIDDENFEKAVIALRTIKQRLGSLLGGVNIMNKRRLLAMVESRDVWRNEEILSEMQLRHFAKKRNLPDWAVLGGIYAPHELIEGAQDIIRQEFRPFANKILFLSRKKIDFLNKVLEAFPIASLVRTVKGMSESMNLLEGVPSRVALPLAYLKNQKRPENQLDLSPDRDGCGLIWFSPLLPIEPALARDFTQEVTRVCLAEGIEPLITLTGISERCFDSTIPLVFDVTSELERIKARKCFESLIEVAREFGIFPYRMDIDGLRKYYDVHDFVSVQMIETLKNAIDPKGILSPGRYSPAKRKNDLHSALP
jgi:4-cresol dehydrogenase (hydroxylating)